MNCRLVRDQLADYLKQELGDDQRTRFDAHLAECDECRRYLEGIRPVWADLDEDFGVQPSPRLRERFYRMLDDEVRTGAVITPAPVRLNWRDVFQSLWPTRPTWALAYSILLITCGLLAGRVLQTGTLVRDSGGDQPQLARIHDEVAELRDLMAFSLLSQDSVQARLRGVDYARETGGSDPKIITLLLNTAERDEAVNVRLAALDALTPYMDDGRVSERIYNSLITESSPIVQLKKVELLLDAAGDARSGQLRDLLDSGILDANVAGYLRAAGGTADGDGTGAAAIEL